MLDIEKKSEGSKLTMVLSGRVDTDTARLLSDEIDAMSDDVVNLVLDMGALGYVSSAGLRALLLTVRKMNERGGSLTLLNVPELIIETFEMTNILDVFTIA